MKWIVSKDDVRREGPSDSCFYCNEQIGNEHGAGCPVRIKAVMVEVKIKTMMKVPEHWDADMIDFHMNDSSWCFNNIVDYLIPNEDHCLCSHAHGRYIRDATEDDKEIWDKKSRIHR